jgi:sulfite exporter TauE/SafE/plastocyanin domain-containing protein/copper chaperone CopZ
MGMKKERIKVYDMTCTSCEKRVERAVTKLNGVKDAKASFAGQCAEIEYDDKECSLNQIKTAIKGAGYTTETSKDYKFIGILVVAVAIVLLGLNTGSFNMDTKLQNASYAVLFMVGVLTSIHCVGMCGGIMLSQSLNKENKNKFDAMKPAILYNMGRVLSYTILGGIVGAIGSVFALSLKMQAGLQLFAGIFMIMMGLNMAGFSAFRKFQIKMPVAFCKMRGKQRTPFLVGFLNGFMPCGPLQTMQIFALGTGSAVAGALSMFMFSLGTVPLMLTFGALSGLLSKGYTKKLLKYSGVLIILLGLIMGNRGLALAGMNMSPKAVLAKIGAFGTDTASANAIKATVKDGVQYLNMSATYSGYTPNELFVQKGMPVKFIVDGKELTGCNNSIVIPTFNIQKKLQSGANLIEFTPGNEDIPFSCWMGMKNGMIKVVDDLKSINTPSSDVSEKDANSAADEAAVPQKPSIYGEDISKVPTDRLIKMVQDSANGQIVSFKGDGNELEPLIVVTKTGTPTKLSLDLSLFDNPEGNFAIVNATTLQILNEFKGQKGLVEVDFTISKNGAYGILLNDQVIGFIESVDNVESVNLEEIRSEYFQ